MMRAAFIHEIIEEVASEIVFEVLGKYLEGCVSNSFIFFLKKIFQINTKRRAVSSRVDLRYLLDLPKVTWLILFSFFQ